MPNLERYINAMAQAKSMLKKGIINQDDFYKIEDKVAEKYCIKKGSIYRPNDLLFSTFRAI